MKITYERLEERFKSLVAIKEKQINIDNDWLRIYSQECYMSKQPYMLSNNNKSCTFSEFF